MGFLSDKNSQVRHSLAEHPLDVGRLEARAQERPPARAWVHALSAAEMSLIAEVKRSSPSAGHIADTDPAQRARTYEAAGAAAISVLTEERHFGGSLADLEAVHGVTSVPILRKDFLVDASQLLEARAEGADAALLIAASLSADQLDEMLGAAGELRLGILLEIHSLEDLDKALSTDAVVIGVNARDLETLEVDAERVFGMLADIPADRIAVSESGVSDREQVVRAAEAGARAVLVGEALMRAEDPAGKIGELLGGQS